MQKHFCIGDTPNQTEEVFVFKNNAFPWTYVTEDLNREKYLGTYYEEELQNTNQTDFRV